jgi:alkylated DNA repair dioxygenase AlkB
MTTPKHFHYFPDVIPVDLEQEILDYFMEHPEEQKPVHAQSRQVRQYGYAYDYGRRGVGEKLPGFPDCIAKLLDVIPDTDIHTGDTSSEEEEEEYFDQCICNRYMPGEGIGKHTDHRSFGNVIACFTLQAGIEMEFERKGEVYKQYVKPRSLYVMRGESRWSWTHQIRQRKNDVVDGKRVPRGIRWSVTFRNVNH